MSSHYKDKLGRMIDAAETRRQLIAVALARHTSVIKDVSTLLKAVIVIKEANERNGGYFKREGDITRDVLRKAAIARIEAADREIMKILEAAVAEGETAAEALKATSSVGTAGALKDAAAAQ